MPNWCCNTLRIVPETDAARALLPQIAEKFIPGNNFPELAAFQFIHPMPAELKDTTSPSDGPNWYDWRVANWGTKWEETNTHIARFNPSELLVSFETAWAPPIGVYKKLVELGFDVLATYAEQGMGYAGHWHNGDDCEISLGAFNVPDADDEYPDDIEVLGRAFAGSGLPAELLPPGLGG